MFVITLKNWTGTTLAQTQSVGKVPELIGLLNRKERGEAICSAQHLSKCAGIRSGPQDLVTSRVSKKFHAQQMVKILATDDITEEWWFKDSCRQSRVVWNFREGPRLQE